MENDGRQFFRRLNAYDYRDYDGIIQFINSNYQVFPKGINTPNQRARFMEKFGNNQFRVVNNELVYPIDTDNQLIVVRGNEDIRNDKLNALYNDLEVGMGHGIQQFYLIVINRYLNITRKQVQYFLQTQQSFQITRKPRKPKNQGKRFNEPNKAWAMDLIDVSQNRRRHGNHNMSYILSVTDLYSKKCWLRALKNKTPEDVLQGFLTFMNTDNTCQIMYSDNGNEFLGVLKEYFTENRIKVYTTETYTAQPNIESLNGQVRKMLAELAVRNNNFAWVDYLPQIEANLNAFNELPRNVEKREKERQKRIDNEEDDDDVDKHKFSMNEIVRVTRRATDSDIRKHYKEGTQKHVFVKYSIDTYKIARRYNTKKANGFYTYALKTNDELEEMILNTDETNARFRESDLLSIPQGQIRGHLLTEAQAKILNKQA